MVSIATFVMRSVVPFLIKRLTETEILSYSIFTAAFAFVLLPFFVHPYALAAIAFLLGLGVGCAQPTTMSLAYVLSPRDRIAEVTGLRKTVINATHLVIPLIFGSIGSAFGFAAVFISNSVMLTIAGSLIRKVRMPEIKAKTGSR
jgi:MFS family permease